VPVPHIGERLRESIHGRRVNGPNDLADLAQIDGCK
jgi:hypothetical protein